MSIPTAGAAANSAPTAPNAPATQATPATAPSGPPARAPRKTSEQLVAEINGTAAPAAVAPAAKPSTDAAAQAAATALEAAGVEVPTQKPGETKTEYAHKLAQLQLRAERADAEVIRHKKTADLTTNELKTLKAQLETLKDPVKALAHAGMDPIKFAEAMRDGKITAAQAAVVAELSPELQELVDQGKAAKALKAQQDAETASVAEYTRKLELVTPVVARPEFIAAYPLIAAQPAHAARILAIIENDIKTTGKEPTLTVVAERYQAAIKTELSALLKSPSVLQALKSDPELAGFFASTAPAAPAEPTTETPAEPTASTTPTLTSKVTSSVPSRSAARRTDAELAAEIRKMQGL